MLKAFGGVWFGVAAVAAPISTVTWAQSAPYLPAASVDVTLGTSYLNPGTYTQSFDYSGDYPGGSAGTMTGTGQLSPFPLASLSVASCCSDYGHGQARVDVTYYAELTGPTGVTVPMELFEHLTSTESGGDAYGWAEAEVGIDGATQVQEILDAGGGDVLDGASSNSAPGILRFDVMTGHEITIHLAVNGGALQGSTSSTADPYLTIDPSFAAVDPNFSTDYVLSFSPGIVNTMGSVPEPPTWLMMLLGFGGIGLATRAHRRRQSTPAELV